MAINDTSVLKKRAEDHWHSAQDLATTGNEWSAVAAFYSCYNLARVALLSDPIFQDFPAMKMAHQNLTPDDRYTVRHQVRKGSSTGFGVNNLVQALYKFSSGTYHVLHRGSIQVRYEEGLIPPLTIEATIDKANEFRGAFFEGKLIHSVANSIDAPRPPKSS